VNSQSDDEEFENLEGDYEGPRIFTTPSLFTTARQQSSASCSDQTSLRFFYVHEQSHNQAYFDMKEEMPKSMDGMIQHLKGAATME
jgi:hypothetical protein